MNFDNEVILALSLAAFLGGVVGWALRWGARRSPWSDELPAPEPPSSGGFLDGLRRHQDSVHEGIRATDGLADELQRLREDATNVRTSLDMLLNNSKVLARVMSDLAEHSERQARRTAETVSAIYQHCASLDRNTEALQSMPPPAPLEPVDDHAVISVPVERHVLDRGPADRWLVPVTDGGYEELREIYRRQVEEERSHEPAEPGFAAHVALTMRWLGDFLDKLEGIAWDVPSYSMLVEPLQTTLLTDLGLEPFGWDFIGMSCRDHEGDGRWLRDRLKLEQQYQGLQPEFRQGVGEITGVLFPGFRWKVDEDTSLVVRHPKLLWRPSEEERAVHEGASR